MSELDKQLMAKLDQWLQRLHSLLPPSFAVMTWIYDRATTDLEVSAFAATETDTAEILRVLSATRTQLLRRDARLGVNTAERYFAAPADTAPAQHLVSSATVTRQGGHDRVVLWSRGGSAGELVVEAGDGERLAQMLQLRERL